MRKIVKSPSQILNQPTQPVTKFDENLRRLVREMEEILENQHHPEGVGLSANQIGVNLRVAVVRLNPEERGVPRFLAIVNPRIVSRSEATVAEYEGCLSLPDQYGQIARYQSIVVEFQDLTGKKLHLNAEGFLARVFQHEIDHLDGKLITGKVEGKLYTEAELEERFGGKNAQN